MTGQVIWITGLSVAGKTVDIKNKIANAGTTYFPDAVSMICNPGDVVISN